MDLMVPWRTPARRSSGPRRRSGVAGWVGILAIIALALTGCVYSSPDPAARPDDAGDSTDDPTDDSAGENELSTPEPLTEPTAEEPTGDAEPEPSPTPVPQPGWIIIEGVVESLNVRAGPGTDNPVITQAPLGTILAATGAEEVVDDDTWFEVRLDEETTGWVHGNFVALASEPTPTPLPTPTPREPVVGPDADRLRVDAPDGLRLRTAPRAASEVIRTVPDGRVVRPTGASAEDDAGALWLEVRFRDDSGWVAAAFLVPAD